MSKDQDTKNLLKDYLKEQIGANFHTQVWDKADQIDPNESENWGSLVYGFVLASLYLNKDFAIPEMYAQIPELASDISIDIYYRQTPEWDLFIE